MSDETPAEIVQNHQFNKVYSYSLEDTNLAFSLAIDKPDQLTRFKTLLERALAEVSTDLGNINNPGTPGSAPSSGATAS